MEKIMLRVKQLTECKKGTFLFAEKKTMFKGPNNSQLVATTNKNQSLLLTRGEN
jgi:hypothetical protein